MAARSSRRTLFWMVLVALALRLIVMLFVYRDSFDPQSGFWSFGFEEGRVARSLVTGHGFANPLYGSTGATAWFAPIYPLILAGVFKVFGVYTKAACFAILSFNDVVSALTCIPIFLFTRKTLGCGIGLLAGWIWAFFPGAIYGPNSRIWDTWLATLLLALLFFVALKLEDSRRVRDWLGFGLLSGVAALTSPVVLSVLPILALWMIYRQYRRREIHVIWPLAAILGVILVVSPWIVRNYHVFHRFIPVRDDLGLELAAGNNGDTRFTESRREGPWLPEGAEQWREYQRLGELAYFEQKKQEAVAYIKEHPGWYAWMVARRILNTWTDYWSLSAEYLTKGPYTPITVPLYTLLSVLTFLGLRRAFREKGIDVAMPYAIVLIFFPLVYYATHTGDWYRRPIDPFLVTLAGFEVTALVRRRRKIPHQETVVRTESESPQAESLHLK